jgi:hypothetical protein
LSSPALSLTLAVRVGLPAQPVQLNALFYKFGAYLTGMKCFFFSISSGLLIIFFSAISAISAVNFFAFSFQL